ncbi:MAG: hypothetical protein Q8R04_04965 [Nanoarchaeota archaeon]|nr:hypothetical protein [Nanoarchaeota archaeon]
MRNSKGFIISGLATVLLYFGFILLIIIFYFALRLTIGEKEVKITGHITDADVNYEVLNYLRMPVKFNIDNVDRSTDMAGLLTMYYLAQGTENEGKFQTLVREKTSEIFNEKHPHLRWKLKISDKNNFVKSIASGQTTSELTKEVTLVKGTSVACLVIPNPALENPIKMEFDFLDLSANAFERSKYDSLKNTDFNC